MLSGCLLVPSTSPLSWCLHGRQAQIRTETATGPCAGDMLFTHQKAISRVCIRNELSFPTGLLQTCLLFPKEPRFPQTVGLPPTTCFRLRLAKPRRQPDRWADSPPPPQRTVQLSCVPGRWYRDPSCHVAWEPDRWL